MHGRASVFVPKNMMCFFGVFWFLFGVFGPLQSDHTGPAAVGNQHHQLTYLTRHATTARQPTGGLATPSNSRAEIDFIILNADS